MPGSKLQYRSIEELSYFIEVHWTPKTILDPLLLNKVHIATPQQDNIDRPLYIEFCSAFRAQVNVVHTIVYIPNILL